MTNRCEWAATPLSIEYHDQEWGVPLHDDQRCSSS
jgi:DNA-3-methyladenine glycosylase I